MAKNLVIVESPAKAKTINKYLGKEFEVVASMGHVRDLPQKKLGVDVKRGFAPHYEVLPKRKKIIDDLKVAAAKADAIYLAADPDREGEAICWHLAEELGQSAGQKVHRVVFNEITKRAIEEAFQHPAAVNAKKVDAQQARRILDRLVGYKVSPILWQKVRRGLSAGRVQSVALKLICERERAIKAFVAEEYWSVVAALLGTEPPQFPAELLKKDGKSFAITNGTDAAQVKADLEKAAYRVAKVQKTERRRRPVPPFITSKLQQESFKKLRFSVKKTMQVAQRLYEGVELGSEGSVGLITYMRTDSTRISADALAAVRDRIRTQYGDAYLPEQPIVYKTGSDAQDAHEAIRPTYLDKDPESLKKYLSKDEYNLYKLIWNRFLASQMMPAVYDQTTADIEAGAYTLRARGSTLRFRGFLAVYEETPDEAVEAPPKPETDEAEPTGGDRVLPPLADGQKLTLVQVDPAQHFTQPPPRFSEASLVKELEENGIGRPSTYASILATIEAREYVEKRENKLYPSEVGFVVTDLLSQHFADIMNVEYTAAMEKELDQIEEGTDNLLNTLSQFWKKFEVDLEKASVEMENVKAREEPTDEVCEKCNAAMVIKWGRFGRFLACTGYPECKNTRQMAGAEGDGPEVAEEVLKEVCANDGQPMVLKKGRFGPFLACSNYPDCKATRRLVRGEGGRLQLEVLKPIDEKCPDCGHDLAWRRGRFGPFIACSKYPDCKYIKKKEVTDIGVLCPECQQGQVVERKGKWGRSFYGCRRYPDCKFTEQARPVPEPCPDCGKPYLVEKETKKEGKFLACPNEACTYRRDAVPA